MSPRDTRTGAVLEQMIIPSLERGGYRWRRFVNIGERLGGGKHIIDLLIEDASGRKILVSVKWQQVAGTAEQKVPFEVICLAHAVYISKNTYHKAYLVLGGPGWKLRDFYLSGGLTPYLNLPDIVSILSLESFVAKANRGEL